MEKLPLLKKYQVPKLKIKHICQLNNEYNEYKTQLLNITQIACYLEIDASYLVKYFSIESNSLFKNEKKNKYAYLNGIHTQEKLDEYLTKFVETFLLCKNCQTLLVLSVNQKHNSLKKICQRCDFTEDYLQLHRIRTYIIENPPKRKKCRKSNVLNNCYKLLQK